MIWQICFMIWANTLGRRLIWHRESKFDFHFDSGCQTQTDLSLLDINPLWSLFSFLTWFEKNFWICSPEKVQIDRLNNLKIPISVFKLYSSGSDFYRSLVQEAWHFTEGIWTTFNSNKSLEIGILSQILLQSFSICRYPRIDWRKRDQNIWRKIAWVSQ